ncbi:unnamed protein product [Bemisia tabaci]|uniref:Double jelly roll-like domain-containing protein n=1 Tax=Bemisia tabaci TaxID=7038 RepID=A0A9P0AEZ5_BEMTA|nr:unnamed protein product [Bemisia tabaci]
METSRDIKYYQYHPQHPYIGSFRNSDEIRIPVNSQDLYTVPGESKLYVEGTVEYIPKGEGAAKDDGKTVFLSNNAIAFLFDQVRYEVNGKEIDRTKHVGLTSTARTLLTRTKDEVAGLEYAGWGGPSVNARDKTFRALVPLSMLLGFADDFKGVLIRVKQELVLIRSRTDKNAFTIKDGAEENAVHLLVTKVVWEMPQVQYNLGPEKAILDKMKRNESFQIAFRSWETHEYPQLPANDKETWKLMTTSNVEAPSYIILIFQTNRLDNEKKDASKFDHVKLRSFKVHLNNASLPYEALNEDFENDKFLFFLQYYLSFMVDYSQNEKLCEPPLSMSKFKEENPMFAMKCLYEDIIKPGPLDIQIDLEANENFPRGTSAYAILVHDVMYSYQSLSGTVKKLH